MSAFSVCIVTYNSSDNIIAALSSIYSCCPDITVFISDNRSSDGTAALVREKFPQAAVIENKENRGFGAGNNAVIPLLDSELHFIVNPDIIVKNDVFSQFGEYFRENPDVVMAVPKYTYADGSEQFTPKLRPKLRYMIGGRFERFGGVFKKWRDEYTLRGANVAEPVEIGFCGGCFMCVRTEIFKRIGGFDERYFLYNEDADITREAQKYGRTMYVPYISVVHLWERAYMKKKKYFFIQISSMMKYFRKWRGKNGGN